MIKFHSVGKGATVLKNVLSLQLRASVKLTLSQISAQHIATRTDQYGLPFNVRRLYRTIKCTMLMKNDVALRTSPISSAMELAHRSLSKSHCGTLLCNTSITAFFFQSRLKQIWMKLSFQLQRHKLAIYLKNSQIHILQIFPQSYI